MSRQSQQAKGYHFAQLTQRQVDILIDSLLSTVRDRALGPAISEYEQTAEYLTGFYTRRWGLPPAITRRMDAAAATNSRQ